MVKNTFFENISVYNYFRKNNEDTFFLENLILFKNDVLIIFSKISGFCSISQFSKEKWFVELKTQFFLKNFPVFKHSRFYSVFRTEFKYEIRISI